jgi:hypothetical protein
MVRSTGTRQAKHESVETRAIFCVNADWQPIASLKCPSKRAKITQVMSGESGVRAWERIRPRCSRTSCFDQRTASYRNSPALVRAVSAEMVFRERKSVRLWTVPLALQAMAKG